MVETTNGCVENDNCERKLAFGRDSWIFIQAYIFLRLWAMCPKNSLIKKRSNLRLKLYVFIEKSQEEREPQRTMSSLCDWYYFSTCETLDWMKLRYHAKTIISLILVWFYPNMYRTVVLLEILGKMPQISDWNWTLVIGEKKAAVWRWKVHIPTECKGITSQQWAKRENRNGSRLVVMTTTTMLHSQMLHILMLM